MPPSQPVLPTNRAFLVQFRTPPTDGLSSYAGRVEHVVSGQMARFHSLEELLAQLTKRKDQALVLPIRHIKREIPLYPFMLGGS